MLWLKNSNRRKLTNASPVTAVFIWVLKITL